MTDREKFVEEIRVARADDTPRLVFADWLEENAESDADVARATYIRLSCGDGRCKKTGKKTRSGIMEGRWLEDNFARLLPSLDGSCFGGLRLLNRDGSLLSVRWYYGKRSGGAEPREYKQKIDIRFWKGFAVEFTVSTVTGLFRCGGLVRQDEPFASPVVRERLYTPVQNDMADCLAYSVRYGHLGPIYDLVTGHDQTTIYGLVRSGDRKLFNVRSGRTQEDVVEAIDFSTSMAMGQWLSANRGRSFERATHGVGLIPVMYPIDYATFKPGEEYHA